MKTIFQRYLYPAGSVVSGILTSLILIKTMRLPCAYPVKGKRGANPNEVFIFYGLLFFIAGPGIHLQAQKATAVTGVSITVEDLDREVAFFTEVLDFKQTGQEKWEGAEVSRLFGLQGENTSVQMVTLQLGNETICLMDFDGAPSRAIPADTRSNDLWFQHLAIVVSDMDAAYKRLLEAKVAHVSTAPQTLPDYLPNAAGIKAFYFRDPEGHNLELIWFPPGKGDPKWQQGTSVFQGIDHTAIGISDTEKSMAFYRDQLGLVHGGHSENYGTEQEHLNQVFGARLDINGLHAASGFGVEFLNYIAPPGGRAYPPDSRADDLWHYQTEIKVDDLNGLMQKLDKEGLAKKSFNIVEIGSSKMCLYRDPDGHAVLLRQAME
jgi:catechol 2,3-dioxygenase-like lactoylglutathione lyase family enzyme